MRGLRELRVLVTGGAQGIGRAVVERFALEGARVAVNDVKDEPGFRDWFAALPPSGERRHCIVIGDVSDECAADRIVEQAARGLGGLDVLVNNAGIQLRSPTEALTLDAFERVLAVNLRGTFLCSRAAIRHFLANERRGSIINTSSVHEIIPKPEYLAYSASKGAIGLMTGTLALEYARRGIRVNAVAPGSTLTPLNPHLSEPAALLDSAQRVPMGRVANAAEIAGAFAFLASDDAAYVTGQTLYVDGGLTLYGDFAPKG